MSDQGKNERILIIRGPMSKDDIRLMGGLAARLGFSVEDCDLSALRELRERIQPQLALPYSFDEINSGEQFICREHALLFRASYLAAQVSEKLAIVTFGHIVDPWVHDTRLDRRRTVEEIGLVVKKREEAGFPSLAASGLGHLYYDTKIKANKVVQVGSFLDFMGDFGLPGFRISGVGEVGEFFLRRLAHQLKTQLQAN